jgi:hypothetical protein
MPVSALGRPSCPSVCDVGHAPADDEQANWSPSSGSEPPAWRAAMPRNRLEVRVVPRVELDHRARDARLRIERVERSFAWRPAAMSSWLGWFISSSRPFRIFGKAPRKRQTAKPLSNQRPSCADQTLIPFCDGRPPRRGGDWRCAGLSGGRSTLRLQSSPARRCSWARRSSAWECRSSLASRATSSRTRLHR